MRKAVVCCLVFLALGVLLRGSALSAPKTLEGKFTVTGKNNLHGSYSGTVTISKSGTRYRVQERAKYSNGESRSFTAYGNPSGNTLTVSYYHRYTTGIIGSLHGNSLKTKYEKVTVTYRISGSKKTLWGTYSSNQRANYKGTETLRRTSGSDSGTGSGSGTGTGSGSDATNPEDDKPIEVDMDVILPGGSALSDDKEDTDGVAIQANIDDDDKDGGAGGDKDVNIVGDRDDKNGVSGENDLFKLQIKAKETLSADHSYKVSYSSENIRIYKDAQKKELVPSGSELPSSLTTLYLEGYSATPHESGTLLSLKLYSKNKKEVGSDTIKVHVAENIFVLNGHGSASSWAIPSYGRSNGIYGSNPYILKGKDTSGKTTYYALYSWDTQKMAKVAMGTPGAYVAYDGHSNFGLGYAFDTHKKTIAEFMNIANDYVPINWPYLRDHQEHPGLMFDDSEYGDDKNTAARFDVVQVSNNPVKGKRETVYSSRFFDHSVSGGYHLSLTRGAKKWEDHHYGGSDNPRIVIKAGSHDLPAKKWRMIFLNSCYSGQYYYSVFNHGVLFYTIDEASSSQTTKAWIKAIVEGKDKDGILEAINKEENINDYCDFGG